MAKTVTSDDIVSLARLARLKLTNAEIIQYQKELSAILDYVALLSEADTDGLEPTSQITGLTNVMRADKTIELSATPDDLLEGVPAKDGRYIKVKRMI